MDEMMCGQRGWRELAILGDNIEKLSGMLEGFIWSPRSSEANDNSDDWVHEEVINNNCISLLEQWLLSFCFFIYLFCYWTYIFGKILMSDTWHLIKVYKTFGLEILSL